MASTKATAVATGSGATVGAAASEIIVWVAAQYHTDMSPIGGALTVILTAALGFVGYFAAGLGNRDGKHEA